MGLKFSVYHKYMYSDQPMHSFPSCQVISLVLLKEINVWISMRVWYNGKCLTGKYEGNVENFEVEDEMFSCTHRVPVVNLFLFYRLVAVDLPEEAKTPSTRFRWWQPGHSGKGFDQWAIDEVTLGQYANLRSMEDDFDVRALQFLKDASISGISYNTVP